MNIEILIGSIVVFCLLIIQYAYFSIDKAQDSRTKRIEQLKKENQILYEKVKELEKNKNELTIEEINLINRSLSDSMNYKPKDRFDEKMSLLIKFTYMKKEREDK